MPAEQEALEAQTTTHAEGSLRLDSALEAEYFRLTAEAGSKAGQVRRQRDTAARDLADESSALQHARESASNVTERIQRLQVRPSSAWCGP